MCVEGVSVCVCGGWSVCVCVECVVVRAVANKFEWSGQRENFAKKKGQLLFQC